MLTRLNRNATKDDHVSFVVCLSQNKATNKGPWDYGVPSELVCYTGNLAHRRKVFCSRREMNMYEQAVVAAETGIQLTGTYKSPLMRDTYNMKPTPNKVRPSKDQKV